MSFPMLGRAHEVNGANQCVNNQCINCGADYVVTNSHNVENSELVETFFCVSIAQIFFFASRHKYEFRMITTLPIYYLPTPTVVKLYDKNAYTKQGSTI